MVPFDISSVFRGASRVAIVGVGSEFRGDDAAGVLVARNLKKIKSPDVLVIEAGVAPENFTSQIKKFKPAHVILIDAADFKAEPGTVRLFEDLSAAIGQSISTHRLSLSMLSDYIHNQTSAKVLLVGIQPAVAEMGGEMCKAVKDAINEVTKVLVKNMRSL